MLFSDGDLVLARFLIADFLKDGAISAVNELLSRDIKSVMVTGDKKAAAERIAGEVGIKDCVYGVLPEGKAEVVQRYRNDGCFTAMVGDGINDSVALKTADVGIAVGDGTDVAIESSDAVLVGGEIGKIPVAVDLGKKTYGVIKGNLFWAFFYNVLLIPIAAGVLFPLGIALSPALCSASMSISSLFVVLNALRIKRFKNEKTERGKVKMKKTTVKIDGMMCGMCEAHVCDLIRKNFKVKKVTASHLKNIAEITSENGIDEGDLKRAFEPTGYKIVSVTEEDCKGGAFSFFKKK